MAEILPDPFEDRVMKEVLAPPHLPLDHKNLFPNSQKFQIWKKVLNDFRQDVLIQK